MYMALARLATVVAAFSRSLFLRPLFPDHPSPSETIFYFHGAVLASVMVALGCCIALFGSFVGLAIAKRHVAQTHKRLMLLAAISSVSRTRSWQRS